MIFSLSTLLTVVVAGLSCLQKVKVAAIETHTLYYVPLPAPTDDAVASDEIHQTVIVKPIATLDDGTVTRYEEQLVQSLIVVHPLSGTKAPYTLLSQPATRTITFEQGSATIRYHEAAYTHTLNPGYLEEIIDGQTQNCTLDVDKMSGSCVQVLEVPRIDGTSTTTATYSGSLVPFATITNAPENPKSDARSLNLESVHVAAAITSLLLAFLII
ncbi:hypothetical protein D9619_004647 [Psilocybe cf. subviscida]|uniref:Uncharacterized protein n=1 Tax=Psilocybe cf. subviscida TaxID=2480587 RepID=A0A8H5F8J0_9AGAR|nr:hypothetical protein D9619_004647 [Psilocybe cf. subviscida]